MPPPTYNPVWLDEFGPDNSASPRRHQAAPADHATPHVLVQQPGGATGFHRQAALGPGDQSEAKVPLLAASSLAPGSAHGLAYQSTYAQAHPLLNRGSMVECRYQSTQDSGYEQSQDECVFPAPHDIDYGDPLQEEPYPASLQPHQQQHQHQQQQQHPQPGDDPPPPEVAFETSLDLAYEEEMARLGQPGEGDDGYTESCASSSGVNAADHRPQCDHAKDKCAYMNASPFGDFLPTGGDVSSGCVGGGSLVEVAGLGTGNVLNGDLHQNNCSSSPLRQVHGRYSTSLSSAHSLGGPPSATSPRRHQQHQQQQYHHDGTLPPATYNSNCDMPPQSESPATLALQPLIGATGGHQGRPNGNNGNNIGSTNNTGGSSRNIARLTLDGLELEIQVAPQNCYSGFAPETILRASKARQRAPAPTSCAVMHPEEVGEIILSDVSHDGALSAEPGSSRSPARLCWHCSLRAAALVAHIGFFVCVGILGVQIPIKKRYDVHIFILRHDQNAQRELPKPYDEAALVAACVMLFLCYLVALGESYTADTEVFVNHTMSREALQGYTRELRTQVPTVGWDVVCYHLETRQVTRTTRDRWGNETTSTTDEEVKVMTHRETLRFPFRVVKDISGDMNLKGTAITKIEFHQMYGFLDMMTAQKFTQIKEKLKERNRYRDEKMEFKEIFAMDNLKAHVTVFGEYGCLRQLMRPKIFCFFSCFLFSWPFRLILKLTTKKRKYTVIKVLGL